MSKNNWSNVWPTETGFYWFYGILYKGSEGLYQLYFAKVRKTLKSVVYIIDGHFVYECEGAKGVWTLIPTPELPILNEEK